MGQATMGIYLIHFMFLRIIPLACIHTYGAAYLPNRKRGYACATYIGGDTRCLVLDRKIV